MEPMVIIPVKLNGGETDYWGLSYDDHCVVVLHKELFKPDAKWEVFKGGYIPHYVAMHMSSLALSCEVYSVAVGAALNVTRPRSDDEPPAQLRVVKPAMN